jgi:hypothetical protein
MISFVLDHIVVIIVTGCCTFALLAVTIAIKILIDAPDRNAIHASGGHLWLGKYTSARHALKAAMNVPGPVASAEALGYGRAGDLHVPGPDLDALPPAPAGPGTLLPVYGYSGRTENQRQLLWDPPGDTTGWSRTDASDLAARLDFDRLLRQHRKAA